MMGVVRGMFKPWWTPYITGERITLYDGYNDFIATDHRSSFATANPFCILCINGDSI